MSARRIVCFALFVLAGCQQDERLARLEQNLNEREARDRSQAVHVSRTADAADDLLAVASRLRSEVESVSAEYRKVAEAYRRASEEADATTASYRAAEAAYREAFENYRLVALVSGLAANGLELSEALCGPVRSRLDAVLHEGGLPLESIDARTALTAVAGGETAPKFTADAVEKIASADAVRQISTWPEALTEKVMSAAMDAIGCGARAGN